MDVETTLRALREADAEVPAQAMGWALDHWDEASPALLPVLTQVSAADGASAEDVSAAFFIAFLAAQKGEVRAHGPLCRIGMSSELVEELFSDSVCEAYSGLLVSTFGGDLGPIKTLIEFEDGEEFARAEALLALVWLARHGRVEKTDAEAYLEGLFGRLNDVAGSFIWDGLQSAVALLGAEGLAPFVRDAFDKELIDPTSLTYDDFLGDLQHTLDHPAGPVGRAHEHVAPVEDVIEELSGWYGFSEAYRRERAALRQSGEEGLDSDGIDDGSWTTQEPATNPFRDVGRNDPCPCGSGKKFKKCCLAAA